MKVIDSNLVIHAAKPEHAVLRRSIEALGPFVSAATLVEVLGYHKLTDELRAEYESFFAVCLVLPITDPIIWRAVSLRQSRRMSLGDSLVAATALEYRRGLWTQNTADFANIPGLHVTNPLAADTA